MKHQQQEGSWCWVLMNWTSAQMRGECWGFLRGGSWKLWLDEGNVGSAIKK